MMTSTFRNASPVTEKEEWRTTSAIVVEDTIDSNLSSCSLTKRKADRAC